MIADYIFYLFSAMVLFSALMVITARHPVHAVLFLILAFFNSAGLMILLGAEFLAMLLVVVYVGAVAVLFLFVVMMLDVDMTVFRQNYSKFLPLGLFVALVLVAELLVALGSWGEIESAHLLIKGMSATATPTNITNTQALGNLLYTHYFLAFQIAGMILLVAMIGAITLTLRTRDGVKKQRISDQNDISRDDAVMVKNDVAVGAGVNTNVTLNERRDA